MGWGLISINIVHGNRILFLENMNLTFWILLDGLIIIAFLWTKKSYNIVGINSSCKKRRANSKLVEDIFCNEMDLVIMFLWLIQLKEMGFDEVYKG